MDDISFIINKPIFDADTHIARFSYSLGDLDFVETITFACDYARERTQIPAFLQLLDLTAVVLGVSYYKLRAPYSIDASALKLHGLDAPFIQDIYENGLGEFYARNDLKRFGKLTFNLDTHEDVAPKLSLEPRTLLPIGGGKDSLVSVQLLQKAGEIFSPFAVNPKGPIISSVDEIALPPIYLTRTLDAEMIRLGKLPGFYNGHVPSTAINSMLAALAAILCDYNQIMLSNERSASEGNMDFDGRETNHQHSKSANFERLIAQTLNRATGGGLRYFSLLRPYSEAKIATIFARETRYDSVFSSCNRNFRLSGNNGALWCGDCPKCHFTFLMLASKMEKERLLKIFGENLLATPKNENAYRELTGLAGQKPWECVGEILEAAACLWVLTKHADWRDAPLVVALKFDLETQYGEDALDAAMTALHQDSDTHLIPQDVFQKVAPYAV